MKYILVTTAVFLLYVCCKPSQSNRSTERDSREVYVYSFKMTYFKKMLLSGFDNSTAIKTVVAADHSGYSEIVLSMDDFRFIDSVVAADRAKLSADSLAGIGHVAEGAGGKRVFDCALTRYQGKWLNDAAIRRSRNYVEIASAVNQ